MKSVVGLVLGLWAKSPSVRRAWIEIHYYFTTKQCLKVALREEGELLKGSHQIDGKKGGHKAEFFGLYSIKSKIRQMQHINAKIN